MNSLERNSALKCNCRNWPEPWLFFELAGFNFPNKVNPSHIGFTPKGHWAESKINLIKILAHRKEGRIQNTCNYIEIIDFLIIILEIEYIELTET